MCCRKVLPTGILKEVAISGAVFCKAVEKQGCTVHSSDQRGGKAQANFPREKGYHCCFWLGEDASCYGGSCCLNAAQGKGV